ncbi:hypothetical protein [Henriciella litoralis]|uniref:hypothetical protein n=1 Tax=Henriciella litoralis TaxID=568102 RepID=UPI0009FE0B24|nr:hypothetical protein [Henriciella litoralis]
MKRVVALLCLGIASAGSALAAPENGGVLEEKSLPLENGDAFFFDISQETQQAVHGLSGLVCPFDIDGHQLTRVVQFSLTGRDVSCGYNSPGGDSTLTFYMSWYGTGAVPDAIVKSGLDAMRQAGLFGDISDTKSLDLAFGGKPLDNCLSATMDISDPARPEKSSVTACEIDGWSFKVRASWSTPDTIPNGGITDFTSTQAQARERLDACVDWRENPSPEADSLNQKTEILLAILTGFAADSESPDEKADDKLADDACYVTEFAGNNTAWLMTASPSAQPDAWQMSRATLDGLVEPAALKITRGITGLTSLLDDGKDDPRGVWYLSGALSESEIGLFRVYRGRPTYEQARNDFIGVLKGEIGSISSIEFEEGGGSTINLAVD